MSVASLANIEKTFGRRVLFDKLSLTIYEGDRIGLIGDNGSGKTSLFRVLVGQLIPDAGSVGVARSIKIGYLTQDPVFVAGNTVLDEAEEAFAELHRLAQRMRRIEHDMAAVTGPELEKLLRQYQQTQHEFDLAGGYAWRHRLEATLLGVGLERLAWSQPVETLSGGQKSRLALARLLISQPDLLLLDEPTNHLDLAAVEWLEDYLLGFSGAVVLISHDRYLLDRLATRIAWLTNCRLKTYKGNYSDFVKQRELEELSQHRAFEKQQADIEKQQEFVRRFSAGQRSKEARGRATRLERLLKSDAVVQKVRQSRNIRLSIDTDRRAGDQVLSVHGLSKAYGENVLWQEINLAVTRGERIGLIGPNGSGKTTLLEVLLGERDADDGNIKWGANLSIGYYDQKLDIADDEDEGLTVIDAVKGTRDAREQELRDILAMMLFRGEEVEKPVRLLSGGERARVRLAQLLLDRPNVLLLDEPTNHLDIASREALESALAGFPGTILCVSHDRYFLNRIIKRLLILRPPALVNFLGNYSDWSRKQAADTAAREAESADVKSAAKSAKSAASVSPSASAKPKKDNPYARPFGRLSLEELEQQIHDTEAVIQQCQKSFGDAGSFRDPAKAARIQREYEALCEKLQQLEAEYFARE